MSDVKSYNIVTNPNGTVSKTVTYYDGTSENFTYNICTDVNNVEDYLYFQHTPEIVKRLTDDGYGNDEWAYCSATALASCLALYYDDASIEPLDFSDNFEKGFTNYIDNENKYTAIKKDYVTEENYMKAIKDSLKIGKPVEIIVTGEPMHFVTIIGIESGVDIDNATFDQFVIIDPGTDKSKKITTISEAYKEYSPYNYKIISPYIIDENKNYVRDKNGNPITDYRQIYGDKLQIDENGHLFIELSAGEPYEDVSSYNWLFGDDENNTISGTSANDVIYAGDGNDTVNGGAGDDIITGGTGNDFLLGDAGNDTYIFNLGDGQDRVYDIDGTRGNVDTIAFGEGIKAEDIILERINYGYDLLLSINGTEDKIIICNFYDGGTTYNIEKVTFADGTEWSSDYMGSSFVQTISGTDGNNTLYGYSSGSNPNEIFNAGAGNDTVYGYNGNDTINSEADNDTVYGGAGDDIITGGTGNDYLRGDTGNDTYIFNLGDGQDRVYDYDSTSRNVDKLIINEDYTNLIFSRNSNDLKIALADSTDSITISSWFSSNAYHVENITASNGYELSHTQVNLLIQSMSSFGSENGITWTQAIEQRPEDVQSIVSQIWITQQY